MLFYDILIYIIGGNYEKNKGFTLIELLAVIVLLGIIFTIGVTSIVKNNK